MTLREILGRVRAWRRRDTLEQELRADVDEHLDRLTADFAAQGLSASDARAAARRQMGNITALREESRSYWGFPAVESALRDLRYALRGLARSPGYTVSIVLTLGLGIGANAAVFGVIDRLMLRPFPLLREPAAVRRVYLQTHFGGRRNTVTTFPYTRFLDISRDLRGVRRVAAVSEWRLAVGTGDAIRVRKVAGVSASFFGFFDAPPAHGRYFAAEEDRVPRGDDVAVISHAFWQSEYGGAPLTDTRLKIGRLDYAIIGVAPAAFVGTVSGLPPDVFVPITTIPANLGEWPGSDYASSYQWDWTEMLVELAPGVSDESADAELTANYIRSRAAARAINPRVLADSLVRPRALAGAVKQAAGPDPGAETRVMLWVAGVAAIVLVIACASVANLMLARLIRRRREVTVRLALGVSRSRLAAQFVIESLLLSLLAAVGGLLIAQWSGVAIRGMLLPEGSAFTLWQDGRALLFIVACSVVVAMLTAAGPALLAGRSDLAAMLKGGVRDGGGRRSRVQSALIVLQVSLSVVLLVGAGLFIRSFAQVRALPLGYDAAPVIEATLDFRGFALDADAMRAARAHLLEVARGLPGIEDVSAVNSRLFATNTSELRVDGIDSVAALGRFNRQVASASYFRVMRTRILRGRGFDASEDAQSPNVVVVSEAMAGVLWPGQDPLGKCIRINIERIRPIDSSPCATVIGVAENAAQQNLGDDPRFMYYLPIEAFPNWGTSTLYIRARGASAAAQLEPVRLALTRAMPGDGLVVVRPLQEVVDDKMRSWELGAVLFTALGALAFVVAAVGLYAVVSYGVAGRLHEIGVRVALGAPRRNLLRLIVRDGIRLALVGCTIGVIIAVAAARWVQPLLYQQSATDLRVHISVMAVMLTVAMVASLLPARRAAAVDPMQALRSE